MKHPLVRLRPACLAALAATVLALTGCAAMTESLKTSETGQQVRLYGSSEVPPVRTGAYGAGTVNVTTDRGVAVTVSVVGMAPTAAHLHEGAADANGPVVLPLSRISENAFVAPDGARLTEAQYTAYKAGRLYVNVHSTKYPGGEVRAQIAGR